MDRKHAPLVSVIIPTYNSASFINEAIASVLAQTYPNIEIIVVDDGSKDNTAEVLRPLIQEKKINYFFKENSGPALTRNFGIQKAKGEFIAFLDSDDMYLPQKIEEQVRHLTDHPEVDISYCDIWHFYDDEPGKLFMNTRSYYGGDDIFGKLLEMNFMNPLMIMMRKSGVQRGELFNEKYTPSEDWEYWARLAYRGMRFSHLDFEPLARYRVRRGSISYGLNLKGKKTAILVFEDLAKMMTPDDRRKYHMRKIISRQYIKYWGAYLINYLSPLKWFYQWLQKKRLGSA